MTARIWQSRWLLSVLLIVGAALFVVGVAAERNGGSDHHDEVAITSTSANSSNEAAEGHTEGDESTEAIGAEAHQGEDETVLGLSLESNTLVTAGVIVSLLLALAAWRYGKRPILIAAGIFACAFAALDIAEVRHQIERSETGIAVLAGVVTAVHLAAAYAAAQRITRPTS